ncbi:hypothetical protein H5410_030819 [Solanum commersonii]|uniref:Uncharacterized protein n=1 Tax=Solanum commersonii TaxID=4109 RepID=A0A9J5YGS6_SOLCO|nr:hypothetical protein H5410_030819 [Solanum commersonii]
MVNENDVVEFYVNLNVLKGNVVTLSINGMELVFDPVHLGKIFNIPNVGLSEEEMSRFHEFTYELVHKGVFSRGNRRHEVSFRDIGIANALENKDSID